MTEKSTPVVLKRQIKHIDVDEIKKQKVQGTEQILLCHDGAEVKLQNEEQDVQSDLPCDNEFDEDEVDPQLVECDQCGTETNINNKHCSNCLKPFKISKSGYLLDEFLVDEVDETVEESEEEEEFVDEESSTSEGEDEDDTPPQADMTPLPDAKPGIDV